MKFWLEIISVTLIVFSFYFTLTFFEHLKSGEQRIVRQSKLWAVICTALASIVFVINK